MSIIFAEKLLVVQPRKIFA